LSNTRNVTGKPSVFTTVIVERSSPEPMIDLILSVAVDVAAGY